MTTFKNFHSMVLSLIALLGVSLTYFMVFGGIVSGIWLVVLGKWALIVAGLLIGIFGKWLLVLPQIPSFIFFKSASLAFNKGNKKLGIFLSSLSGLYTITLISIWCVSILIAFTNSADQRSIIPIMIWACGCAVSPWLAMGEQDYKAGSGMLITAVFFARVSLIVSIFIMYFSKGPSEFTNGIIGITFFLIMLAGYIFHISITYVEKKIYG